MISLIVAMDKNRVIGINNDLPWRLPADLAYFKQTTMGRPIVMGRKTFESIGRPLPGRENVVLTRDRQYEAPGCRVIHAVEDIKALEEETEEIFIIGGAELFRQTLDFADRLYITWIDESFEGDTFFPSFNEALWTLVSSEEGVQDEKNRHAHTFCVYERKR